MKKLKSGEIVTKAQTLADSCICCYGAESAERLLKKAWEKVRAKNVLLKLKYKGDKK